MKNAKGFYYYEPSKPIDAVNHYQFYNAQSLHYAQKKNKLNINQKDKCHHQRHLLPPAPTQKAH
jgi:hypothetical protein